MAHHKTLGMKALHVIFSFALLAGCSSESPPLKSIGHAEASAKAELARLSESAEVKLGFPVQLAGPCDEGFLRGMVDSGKMFSLDRGQVARLVSDLSSGRKIFTFREVVPDGPFQGQWGYLVFEKGSIVDKILCGES